LLLLSGCATTAQPEVEARVDAPLEVEVRSPSDPGCDMTPDALEPMLVVASGAFRDGQLLVEEGEVEGVRMSLTRGGCAHYAETFRYRVDSVSGPALLERAAALLRATMVRDGEGTEGPPSLLRFLDEARVEGAIGSDGGFACGDAVCAVRYNRELGVLEVAYDFPL
jgi:hypothetical protein